MLHITSTPIDPYFSGRKLVVATHGGAFTSHEVMAVAIIDLALNGDYYVQRCGQFLPNVGIAIGMGDVHVVEGECVSSDNPAKEMWGKFGKSIVVSYLKAMGDNLGMPITDEMTESVKMAVGETHISEALTVLEDFNPPGILVVRNVASFEDSFKYAVETACGIIQRHIVSEFCAKYL